MSAPEQDVARPGETSVLIGTTNWLPVASTPFSTAFAESGVRHSESVSNSANIVRKDLIGED